MPEVPHPPHEKATAKDRLLQTIAVLGLIAVLLLGAWGIIQLAFNLPNIFASVGSTISNLFAIEGTSSSDELHVTLPQTITSDQPFSISWEHPELSASYAYTISYSCVTGLSLKAPLPNGSYENVECNKPFNFTNAKERTTLIATYAGAPARVTFTVSAVQLSNNRVAYSSSASAMAQSKSTIASGTSQKGAKTSTKYYASASPQKTLAGRPDLAVRMNAVIPTSAGAAVQFTIENAGPNVAYAGWRFDAHLPTRDGFLYNSAPQQPLYPGDKIVYTLAFDEGYRYRNSRSHEPIVIVVDPRNEVPEQSEINNTVSVY